MFLNISCDIILRSSVLPPNFVNWLVLVEGNGAAHGEGKQFRAESENHPFVRCTGKMIIRLNEGNLLP